jgi:hypothetical protein
LTYSETDNQKPIGQRGISSYRLLQEALFCGIQAVCAPQQSEQQTRATRTQQAWAAMQSAMFSSCIPRAGVFSGSRVAVAPQRAQLLAPAMNRRGAVQVFAAEEQKKKRTPQPEKRAQLALERRSRNRSRKSAIATRTKKVCAIRRQLDWVWLASGRSLD